MSSLTYVYCLVRSPRRPSLRGVPGGLPGGRGARIVEVSESFGSRGRHWLVVSTVPERVYGEEPLQEGLQHLEWVGPRALAHEAVVEHFLGAPAVLPMQLFTLFKNDDRAIEHVVRQRRRISAILKRIENQMEWGLRLLWNPLVPEARGRTRAGARPTTVSGAAYLVRKRDLLDRERVQLKRARADANRLYRSISREVTKARRRPAMEKAAPGSRLLLDAAFLVPSRNTRRFQTAVRRYGKDLERAGMVVSLTGPWPAYNFI